MVSSINKPEFWCTVKIGELLGIIWRNLTVISAMDNEKRSFTNQFY
jgi:hypothetical protein